MAQVFKENPNTDILNKLLKTIGIDGFKEEYSFRKKDFEKWETIPKILELKDTIRQYFTVSNISSFKPNFECKRPYLNVIRSILRQQNYNVENFDCWIKYENGLMKRTIRYKIFR